MARVFYTYVWGRSAGTGGPLIFTDKANRTKAMRKVDEGDFVFAVASRNPADPTVEIPEDLKGRVINAWQVSKTAADSADYGLKAENSWDADSNGNYKFPYALQPIRYWLIQPMPVFKELDGYNTQTHTQEAISTVQEVKGVLAESFIDLLLTSARELPVQLPKRKVLDGRIKQLAQKHPFVKKGYTVPPPKVQLNSIYVATLGKGGKDLKIGHSADPAKRVADLNKYRLSSEKQWVLTVSQPIGDVEEAIAMERHLGQFFASHRTERNNNEIFINLDAMDVVREIAKAETTVN